MNNEREFQIDALAFLIMQDENISYEEAKIKAIHEFKECE